MSSRIRDERSLLVTVPCALSLGLLLAFQDSPGQRPWAVLFCGAAILFTECFPLHFAVAGERHTATFVELPMILGLILAPGRMLALALMSAILISQLIRQLPRRKIAFNLAQYGLAAAVASQAALQWPGLGGALTGIALFTFVNEMAVQLVLRAVAGVRLGVPYRGHGRLWALHLSVSISGGLLTGEALLLTPGLMVALIPPLLLMLSSQRESLRRSLNETLHRSIADHALAVQPFDQGATLRLISDLARDLLAAERAEVLFLDGPRPLLASAGSGELSMHRLPENWLEQEEWFDECLAAGPTGEAKGSRATILLVDKDGPVALLAAFRRAEDESFRADDLTTLEAIAKVSAGWLTRLRTADQGRVVNLNAHPSTDGLAHAQVLRLVQELDLLASRVLADGGYAFPELNQMQDMLTESLLTSLDTGSAEPRVPVGSWDASAVGSP